MFLLLLFLLGPADGVVKVLDVKLVGIFATMENCNKHAIDMRKDFKGEEPVHFDAGCLQMNEAKEI